MKSTLLTGAFLALLTPAALQAQRMDLPPAEKVIEALDNHPTVAAAAARVEAARAGRTMLAKGTHEVTVSGSYIRRTVDREGGYDEFDSTVSRAFRLPGKAALDRKAGTLGVEVAENRRDDVRHQAALTLSTLWHDWLTAGSLYRSDTNTVGVLEAALAAVRRRVQLRDASQLELDQASAALDLARAQAEASRASEEQARVTLAATFPELPLPLEPPELALPELPSPGLEAMRGLVIERSHEIGAADREAQRLDVVARRARADRIADPSLGVRLFSERSGMEQGAGLVMSIPIGGGYRRAAEGQALAEAKAGRLELANVERMVTATADADLSNARTRLQAWKSASAAARSAAEAARRTERGHQLGQIDLTDLLYAQRQANDARRAEIEARSEADRALMKLQIDSHVIWMEDETHDHAH
mgnify:CR=1 FL=1